MRTPTTALTIRTVVTFGYLVALAVAGSPRSTAAVAGLSLLVLWMTPLVLRARQVRSGRRALAAPTVLSADDAVRTA